jgi:GTP cyclohydrolase I
MREGLRDTPRRVLEAFKELTAGYHVDPAALLKAQFERDGYDQVVTVRGIDFTSLCEHHLLPFTGTAAVGYLPAERVVGLSKLARLVQAYASRLQLQERLTQQIATALQEHLQPQGVAVVLRARHACMGCRGIRKPGAEMVTSALLGVFRTENAARAEVLAFLCDRG